MVPPFGEGGPFYSTAARYAQLHHVTEGDGFPAKSQAIPRVHVPVLDHVSHRSGPDGDADWLDLDQMLVIGGRS